MVQVRHTVALALTAALTLGTVGCAGAPASVDTSQGASYTTLVDDFHDTDTGTGQDVTSSMDLAYAKGFTVDVLEGGHALICTRDGRRYLTVGAGQDVPADLAQDIVTIEVPIKDVYLAASDTMCLFAALDATDALSVSGLKRDDWSIPEAIEAFDEGRLVFGGSYRSPDYELLVERGVKLAVESTMINHTPEVRDKLEDLGIGVFVELSSYEDDPLARCEWVRLWGLLTDKQERADQVFKEQVDLIESIGTAPTGKTVAYFYLNSQGSAVVRRPGDYVTKMIELAGGTYAFCDLEPAQAGSSTVTLEMERFYGLAADVDVLIYNGSIDDTVSSVSELIDRCPVLKDSKAVREGQVWATDQNMYQDMIHSGQVVSEMHSILAGDEVPLTYLRRLD